MSNTDDQVAKIWADAVKGAAGEQTEEQSAKTQAIKLLVMAVAMDPEGAVEMIFLRDKAIIELRQQVHNLQTELTQATNGKESK